eukprot:TRINITY_DN11754_c1_g1_i1.p1 TRINITY_DN11754_c1_g1~~TRINITY_DN11754_c1_g1_i1.p1  ORF type:complete len:139 (+),score=4.48 TRINITY_DN11754_c1_g1_i1:622-1038(+)
MTKDFLEVFHDVTFLFSWGYYPTSTQALNLFYEINIASEKYRGLLVFKSMCKAMEVKFSQYWKYAQLTFCLAFALDPMLKLLGVETLLNAINRNMNQTNVNDFSTIKSYLEQFYLEYSTQMGRSETPFALWALSNHKK